LSSTIPDGEDRPVLTAIQSANLGIRFLLELCLLVSIGYSAFSTVQGRLFQIAAGILAALIVALVWGILLAPASSMRLQGAPYVGLEVALFLAAVVGLTISGQPLLGVVLAAAALINDILLAVWHQ
jgi:uncharacterized protein DUF2568